MDWKELVKTAAPTLGGLLTTFGGPAGALAGAGLNAVANALGVPADETSVSAALAQGITPEQRVALVAADLQYKQALLDTGIKEKTIAADVERAYISDTDAARHAHSQNMGVLRLGYLINAASHMCVGAVLYGSFWLLGGVKLAIDPGIAAMVGGIIGAAVQWLMANAAQANGFFFGSSPSSRQVSADLAKAVQQGVTQQPEAQANTTVNVKR